MQLHILIVEDGDSQRQLLRDFLQGEGYQVSEAKAGPESIELVRQEYVDLILLDYKMPGMNGLEVLKQVKQINPEIDIIMMTAYGTIETAVKAMKAGAADYIGKPIDLDELLLQIDRISQHRLLRQENVILHQELRGKGVTTDQIIFTSSRMDEVVNLAGRVAKSSATILIEGESGTGKERIARLIHTLSPRADKPLITVNCTALSENLLESELFGHEKGAFTGALQRRIGRFEEAAGGTLFLDEIGEIPAAVQVKLLRFLQEREFQRVGGNLVLHSDVRIISATNRDLKRHVQEGHFREDLYYRLNVISLELPPLRLRKEDIPLLIEHFLKQFARKNGEEKKEISPLARDLLMKYDYPGNVRELENIIERAVVISRGQQISERELPFGPSQFTQDAPPKVDEGGDLNTAVARLEQAMIGQAMLSCAGHQTKAAKILGISERMLRYKLKKYSIK
jgi:two-component system NtrC family response regulator